MPDEFASQPCSDGVTLLMGAFPWACTSAAGARTRALLPELLCGPKVPELSPQQGVRRNLPVLARAALDLVRHIQPARIVLPLGACPSEWRTICANFEQLTKIASVSVQAGAAEYVAAQLQRVFPQQAIASVPSWEGAARALLRLAGAGMLPSDQSWPLMYRLTQPGDAVAPLEAAALVNAAGARGRASDKIPLVVFGRGMLVRNLYSVLEALGGRVICEEDGAFELLLAAGAPLGFHLAASPATRRRLAFEAAQAGHARAALFVHEAFSGRSVETAIYQSAFPGPLLSIAVEELGEPDARLMLRLEAFFELLRNGARP